MADRRDLAELLPPLLHASLGTKVWTDLAASGDEYGADTYVVGYQPLAVVDAAALPLAKLFARALRQACAPLCKEDLFVEVGKLRMRVVRKAEESEDQQLLFEAYVEDLRDYPADIVLVVLRFWPRRSRFWPSLEELLVPVKWRVRQRAGLLKALEELATRSEAEKVAAE